MSEILEVDWVLSGDEAVNGGKYFPYRKKDALREKLAASRKKKVSVQQYLIIYFKKKTIKNYDICGNSYWQQYWHLCPF
jgi:hypothetical protein